MNVDDIEKVENPKVTLITSEEEEHQEHEQKQKSSKPKRPSFLIQLRNFIITRLVIIFILSLTFLYFALRTTLLAIGIVLSLLTLSKVDGIKRFLKKQWHHFKMSATFFIGNIVGIFNIGVGIGIILAYFLIAKKDVNSDFMRSLRAFLQRHSNGTF